MPRIIDFGVAKAVSQGLNAETMFTRVGMVLSPEQAGLRNRDILRNQDYETGTDRKWLFG